MAIPKVSSQLRCAYSALFFNVRKLWQTITGQKIFKAQRKIGLMLMLVEQSDCTTHLTPRGLWTVRGRHF